MTKKITTNLKIISWNKGPSRIKNTINNLRHIVSTHKPHIMAVQEYNLTDIDDMSQLNIPGYSIELDTLIISHYRRWHTLNHLGSVKHSGRIQNQKARFKTSTQVWQKICR